MWSSIKHDALLKQPKLTVSMCGVVASVAASWLREVVALEVKKLHRCDPVLRAWSVPQMQSVLCEKVTLIKSFLGGFPSDLG